MAIILSDAIERNVGMEGFKLEVAQIVSKHPILNEKESYKSRYIKVLEYFVRKYSPNSNWANESLKLYKNALLNHLQDYKYTDDDLMKQSKPVIATKFKPFKFFSYRYCLIVDCVFLNAFNDREKGELLFEELSGIYHKRYQNNIRHVFEALYNPDISLGSYDQIAYLADCWERNRTFLTEDPIKVIVTATMSAGKSTLLNALIGKKINRTQNDACTAKIHYIKNKPYEDGYCYEQDFSLELDADLQTLMEDNVLNTSSEIFVGTHFRTVDRTAKRIWLIDTPGVNSSQDKRHKDITERYIRETQADLLVYLLNGENIGSEDDRIHLQFVLENYTGRIVFVVNKLDKFRKKEDSVSETLSAVVSELVDIGFKSPVVVPISSAAAYLSKLSIFGETLDEEDQDEFDRMARKLKKNEYQFDTYYPASANCRTHIDDNSESFQLLLHSGIVQLEDIIYGLRG